MFRAYIWIDGETFDPAAFQRFLPKDACGTVEKRKQIVDGVVIQGATYWKSEVVTAAGFLPESSLEVLLRRYAEAMPQARVLNATRVVLEVVIEYSEGQEPQGLFLTEELVQLLARVGAAIDIDVARLLV